MKMRTSVVAGLIAGLISGAVVTGLVIANFDGDEKTAPQRGPELRVGYAPVVSMGFAEPAAIARTIDVIGEARALKSVTITSEVAGLVETVNIAPGARVKEGDILVQIDDREQRVALERARAEYPIAAQNAERYQNLRSDAAASALEAEQALNNFTQVRAQLQAAEVAVAQRRIVAPFTGIAGLTDVEVGDYLRIGDAVTTLDDTSSIIIDFAVPQEAAPFVDIGQKVTATLASGRGKSYAGKITAIDSRVDSQSRTLNVEARFENTIGRLIPGAVFAVSTTAEGEPAIAVSGLAIQWDRSGAFVWRRNEDNAAERVSVVILQRTDDTVLVEGDIRAGDAIVVEGADRVRRGAPLPASTASYGGAEVAAARPAPALAE